jgi:hypothetical protein
VNEWLGAISNVVIAAAAVAAAVIAWRGLKTWRDELRGRTEYDLARRVMHAVYRVREAIRFVRSPHMLSGEYEGRPGRNPDAITSDSADVRYAYQARWGKVSEAMVELDAVSLECEVLWGSSLSQARAELAKCLAELQVNVMKHLRASDNAGLTFLSRKPMTAEELKANDAIIWEISDQDAFGDRVQAAVALFEDRMRLRLRR